MCEMIQFLPKLEARNGLPTKPNNHLLLALFYTDSPLLAPPLHQTKGLVTYSTSGCTDLCQ